MGHYNTKFELERGNPPFVYQIEITSITIEQKKWWGGSSKVTNYHIEVHGEAKEKGALYNSVDFDKVFEYLPNQVDLYRFIDENHGIRRGGAEEKDYKAIEEAARQKRLEEEAARRREKYERWLKAELEREAADDRREKEKERLKPVDGV